MTIEFGCRCGSWWRGDSVIGTERTGTERKGTGDEQSGVKIIYER